MGCTMLENLQAGISGEATEKFLEMLLHGMQLCFAMSSTYHKNIESFRGRYLFRTFDGSISVAAMFSDGKMEVSESAPDDWEASVTFKDPPALRRFLFSKDQDIMDSLLANEVEVEGNLNYVYKFGFMAKELLQRLGMS